MDITINTNDPIPKLACLYDEAFIDKYEYFLLYGGRGGGKTEEMARKGIITTFQDPQHWLCTREIQNSIDDSVKATIEAWIIEMGVEPYFIINKTEIINRITGAKFLFKGMKAGTDQNTIKSLKGIKYIWYEEAQGMTSDSWEMLNPTIRIDGRKLFFTFNRKEVDEPVTLIKEYGDKVCSIEVQYFDNQYLPDVLRDQAEFSKRHYPADYNHIWLGQPLMHGERQVVLPLNLLRRCIDAHLELGHDGGHAYGGLDLAAGEKKENDKNAFAARKGPVVLYSKAWQDGDLDNVADRTVLLGERFNIVRLFFDVIGVGGFATKHLRKRQPKFAAVPFMGGAKVFGGDYPYIKAQNYQVLNKDFFKNAKSQQWWNLRMRMENTIRLLDGDIAKVRDPSYYLSFNSKTVEGLDNILQQLSQATYKEDPSGRVIIDKTPGDREVVIDGKKQKQRSPNDGDTIGYSFVRDFQRRGLRAYL